jgi:hypothetical protein
MAVTLQGLQLGPVSCESATFDEASEAAELLGLSNGHLAGAATITPPKRPTGGKRGGKRGGTKGKPDGRGLYQATLKKLRSIHPGLDLPGARKMYESIQAGKLTATGQPKKAK